MQHIEDDMNELFQRAADSYYLQEPEWNWNDIRPKLSGSGGSSIVLPLVMKKNNDKKWVILLCFLMLPLSAVFVSKTMFDRAKASIAVKHAIKKERGIEVNNTIPVITNKKGIITDKLFSENTNQVFMKGHYKLHSESKQAVKIIAAGLEEDETAKGENKPGLVNLDDGNEEKISANVNTEISKLIKEQVDKNSTTITATKEVKVKKNRKSYIYFGLVAGPDFSKVKSMPFQNAGKTLGVIAGYAINKKLSIETGLLIGQKNYTSQGKYFKLDKVGSTMPPGMVINKLQSKTNVLEVPIKLKYNIINKNRSQYFLAGGISAYIITREKNNYDITYNGNHGNMTAQYEKNNSKSPAVANFSIGYQYALSRNIHIRVEPYLKIPIQGVGMGSLPITSTGIHLGIIGHLN